MISNTDTNALINMMKTTLEICIKERFITTTYEADKHIIVEEWNGFAPSDGFRRVSDELIELMKKKKCGKVLNNFANGKVISTADQEWINESWFPRAVEAGLTHFAFLLAKDTFNQMSVKNIMQKTDYPQLRYRYFGDYEEAEKWLLEGE